MNEQSVKPFCVEDQAERSAKILVSRIIKLKNEKNLDYETIDLTQTEWKSLFRSVETWIDWMVIKDGAA